MDPKHLWLVLPITLLGTLGCDAVESLSSTPPGAPAPVAAPVIAQVPCPRCAGSGQVSMSVEAPLPSELLECRQERVRTGLLGLRQGTVRVHTGVVNQSDQHGQFTVKILAGIPGQPHASAVELDSRALSVPPHGQQATSFDFDPSRLQNLGVACDVEAPTSVLTRRTICPVCNGSGAVGGR